MGWEEWKSRSCRAVGGAVAASRPPLAPEVLPSSGPALISPRVSRRSTRRAITAASGRSSIGRDVNLNGDPPELAAPQVELFRNSFIYLLCSER